jgi:hypothetical protein
MVAPTFIWTSTHFQEARAFLLVAMPRRKSAADLADEHWFKGKPLPNPRPNKNSN